MRKITPARPARHAPVLVLREGRKRRRPAPHLGPHPLEPDGAALVPLTNSTEFARVSVEDYARVMRQGCWRLGSDGYAYRNVPIRERTRWRSTVLALHRLIANARRGELIDHKDGDRLRCTRGNLRPATHSQNTANRTKLRADKSSPFRGVTWHKALGRWQAAAKHGDRCIYLGVYSDPIEAARAYDVKARELWGPFSRVNFPTEQEASAMPAKAA